jgi:hypothetical protein
MGGRYWSLRLFFVFGSFCRFPLCREGYLRVLSELAGCGIDAKHSSHPSLFLEFPMLANTFSNISWVVAMLSSTEY